MGIASTSAAPFSTVKTDASHRVDFRGNTVKLCAARTPANGEVESSDDDSSTMMDDPEELSRIVPRATSFSFSCSSANSRESAASCAVFEPSGWKVRQILK